MDGDIDYIALLKCACGLKERIDQLVNKNPEEISAREVKCTRKEIDNMLKKYFKYTEFNKCTNNYSQTDPKCNNNADNSTKFKVRLNLLSDFDSENDDTSKNVCCEKQNMDDFKKHRNVAQDEDNTNKQKCDLHKKCQEKLKLYEDYVEELECRLTDVTNFMEKKQREDQKNIPKDTNLEAMILKMKKKENCYKTETQRLSKELECERKKSEAYHKWVDEAFCNIKKLGKTAEKISTYSAGLAKSLSLAVVDLPVTVYDDHPSKSTEIKDGTHDDSRNRSAKTQRGSESVQTKQMSTQIQCCHQRCQHSVNKEKRSRNSSRASGQVDGNCVNFNYSICPHTSGNKGCMKSAVTQSEPSSKCYRKSGGNDDPEELEVIYMSEILRSLLARSRAYNRSSTGFTNVTQKTSINSIDNLDKNEIKTKSEESLTVDRLIQDKNEGFEMCKKLNFAITNCEREKLKYEYDLTQQIGHVKKLKEQNLIMCRQNQNIIFHLKKQIDDIRSDLMLKTEENLNLINECKLKEDIISKQQNTIQDLESALRFKEHTEDSLKIDIIDESIDKKLSSMIPKAITSDTGVQTETLLVTNIIIQTNSLICESTAVQTDSFICDINIANVQTDSLACVTIAVQTDVLVSKTSAISSVQTYLFSYNTTAIQTDLLVNKTSAISAVQTDVFSCETNAVQTELIFHDTTSIEVQTDSLSYNTTAVQAHLEDNSTNPDQKCRDNFSSNKDVVAQLLEKFGCDGNIKSYRFNLKALLKKIEISGFKSLCLQELSYIHQKIIENSVKLSQKYTSITEVAVKHLPAWQRSAIKDKCDIVHIFATLDKVIEEKNKEIVRQKTVLIAERDILLSLEIEKRNEVEKQLYSVKKDNKQFTLKNKHRQLPHGMCGDVTDKCIKECLSLHLAKWECGDTCDK